MIGPELQAALFSALTSAAVAGGRIYDRPPAEPTFPYLTIGDEQVIDDGGDDDDTACRGGWEVFSDIHVWSRPASGSKREVKTLAAAAVAAAKAITVVTGYVVVSASLDTSRSFRDPDGITEHTVVTMRYILSPAS